MLKYFTLQERNIYLWSAVVLFVTAIFSVGAYQADEHFQILEFAGLKLGLTSAQNLPWEFHYQMRQTLQPFMIIVLHKFLAFFGITNPFFITFVLRFISATVAFIATYFLYNSLKEEIKDTLFKKWFLLLSFFSWYNLFIDVRFSQENWGGIFLVFAFVFYNHFLLKQKLKNKTINKIFGKYFFVGILLGFSFLFRYQMAFSLLGFGLWLLIVEKEKFSFLFVFFLGFLTVFVFGIFLDSLFYGKFTVTIANYFDQNILQHRAAGFGESAWWWYIPTSIVKAAPIGLLFWPAFLFMAILERKNLITWLVVPFVIGHMFVGHKEIRFLFPLVLFLPYMILKSFSVLQEKYHRFATSLFLRGFMNFLFVVNFLLVGIVMFKPANAHYAIQKEIYRNAQIPTELYCKENDNPYNDVSVIFYYRPKKLQLRPLSSINEVSSILPNKQKQLLITRRYVIEDSMPAEHAKLLYASFPNWVFRLAKQFNIGGWANRTPAYYLYELNVDENHPPEK